MWGIVEKFYHYVLSTRFVSIVTMIPFTILLLLGSISSSLGEVINDLRSRIINGERVALGEMPHLVSLQYKEGNSLICGGSIINKNYVLTAAHCIDENAPQFQVVAGTVDLRDPNNQVYSIKNITCHEKFDLSDSNINDICLLKVDPPFEFSKNIAPIPLPEPDSVLKGGQIVTVAGYGSADRTELPSRYMHKVNVPVFSNEECDEIYQSDFGWKIYDSHVCTLDSVSRHGSCRGDGGGPLTADGVLVGLVSWSSGGCANTLFPSVLTRVSKYLDWINEHAV